MILCLFAGPGGFESRGRSAPFSGASRLLRVFKLLMAREFLLEIAEGKSECDNGIIALSQQMEQSRNI
jgi:hypothetical protein